MNNILCIIPRPDASSDYRAMGPLNELRRQHRTLNLVVPTNEISWSHLDQADCVFLHRPTDLHQLELVRAAKKRGVPVWVDYDDDLFNLPADNPSHEAYSKPDIRQNIATFLSVADHVSVSTKALEKSYSNFNENVSVIPNAFNSRLFPPINLPSRNRVISWRGSNTHERDLMELAPQIIQFANENPDIAWNFIGYKPWFIMEKIPAGRSFFTPHVDYLDYMQYLVNLAPMVHIVPLSDNTFNRSKSNCAWLESTYVGAVALSPDLPEWNQPGIVHYKSQTDLTERLLDLMTNADQLPAQNKKSSDFIKDNLDVNNVNDLRKNILKKWGCI